MVDKLMNDASAKQIADALGEATNDFTLRPVNQFNSGFAIWLDRESWGHIYDGLILERERSLQRKADNPESNSDETATRCEGIMQRIRLEC